MGLVLPSQDPSDRVAPSDAAAGVLLVYRLECPASTPSDAISSDCESYRERSFVQIDVLPAGDYKF
jgi:hypothetical protein